MATPVMWQNSDLNLLILEMIYGCLVHGRAHSALVIPVQEEPNLETLLSFLANLVKEGIQVAPPRL